MASGIENGLREYQLKNDEITAYLEGTIEDHVGLFRKFKPGECFKKEYNPVFTTKTMDLYIKRLKEAGLDIGKENAEFGYKMPLPKKGEGDRILIIFRRR